MEVCKHCRKLFDPEIIPSRFAESLLCSWHPGTVENVGNTGVAGDYAEIWVWSCCNRQVLGPLIRKSVDGVVGEYDYPPPRSPGCVQGPHEKDDSIRLADPNLASEIASLQARLRDLEAFEAKGLENGTVFISYSHKDRGFVDRLAARFSRDGIRFWLDEKEILIGDVIDRAISEGIQKNSLFLVVLTPSSIASKWVQREFDEAAHEAVEGGKIILPLVAKGLGIGDVPARVRRLRCADFNKGFEAAYNILLRSIKLHLQKYQQQGDGATLSERLS